MYARDFCYWFQGLLEISNPETITEEQLKIIKNHLNLVFHFDKEPLKENEKFKLSGGTSAQKNPLGRTKIRC